MFKISLNYHLKKAQKNATLYKYKLKAKMKDNTIFKKSYRELNILDESLAENYKYCYHLLSCFFEII